MTSLLNKQSKPTNNSANLENDGALDHMTIIASFALALALNVYCWACEIIDVVRHKSNVQGRADGRGEVVSSASLGTLRWICRQDT